MEKGRPSNQVVKMYPTKKIGIFGGSFDPVHLGHIGLAKDAITEAGLDKVIFIPAKLQPFKLDKKVTPGEDRLAMLNLATDNIDGLEVSDYELKSDRISYTYLTLREMEKSLGNDVQMYFITGTDSFINIEKWKNAEELLNDFSYIVGSRPGYKMHELEECIERIQNTYNTEVIVINNKELDISSTEIRKRLETGKSAIDLIPDEVERYIREHDLYK